MLTRNQSSSTILLAILANEEAGLVVLNIETDNTTGDKKIFCTPTNNDYVWPDYTWSQD